MRVHSITNTIQPFALLLSPILAGTLLSLSKIEAIFFIDVVTAALAVGLLMTMRVPPLPRRWDAKPTGYMDDLRAGLAYIGRNRPVRALFIFFAATFFLVTPVAFLSPLLVARSFGDEVWRLTANEITFFAGSIIGGVVMSMWGGFSNRFRTIGLGCIIWAGLFAALGLTNNWTVYLALMVLAGLPMPFFNASTVTLLQELVRPEMHGRVFGVQGLIMSTVMPIGMLVFGPLADMFSIGTLLVLASGFMAIPGLWIFFHRAQEASAGVELQPGD
jgi:DHA3 family macrolide efflux protein-like MFS transporter